MDKIQKYWRAWLSIRAYATVAALEAKWLKYNLKRDEYKAKAALAKKAYEIAAAALPKVVAGQAISVPSTEVKPAPGDL
jgi:hypothetical protein